MKHNTATAGEGQQRAVQPCCVKPNVGSYKCNVDAALFESENKYGVDMCIRSSTRGLYKAKTICFNGILTPQEAGAVGLWVEELGLHSVTIEWNCLPFVNGVDIVSLPHIEFGALLSSCTRFFCDVSQLQNDSS